MPALQTHATDTRNTLTCGNLRRLRRLRRLFYFDLRRLSQMSQLLCFDDSSVLVEHELFIEVN
jgi:hypothetical protein